MNYNNCKEALKIEYTISTSAKYPKYATEGSAGMDLTADIYDPLILSPFGRCLIPTGLYLSIPKGYEAQVRARSGLAIKKGLTVLNGIGTIDSDYRGEIQVILINLSNETQTIEPDERVAQLVFAKYEKAELIEVQKLDETKRGNGGFGSTGIK